MSRLLRRAVTTALLIYLVLPILVSLVYSLSTEWFDLLPDGFSLLAWATLGQTERFWAALGRSVVMSFSAVVLSMVLLLPTLFAVRMYYPRVAAVLEWLTLWPFVFPGVLLAVGLIQIYSSPPIVLAQTPFLLIAAVAVIALPYAYRAVDNAFAAIDLRTLAEAARSLGADDGKTLLWIILPSVLPGVFSGGVLAFSAAFGEFALAQLIIGTAWETLPVYQMQLANTDGRITAAITVISFGVAWGLGVLALSLRRGSKVEVV